MYAAYVVCLVLSRVMSIVSLASSESARYPSDPNNSPASQPRTNLVGAEKPRSRRSDPVVK